jgi:hypothetical protein
MSQFEFVITVEGVDVSDAVIAPFSISNGRTTFSQGFAKWSANLRLFKKKTKEIFQAANKEIDLTGAGSVVEIKVYDSQLVDYVTMFRGVITNTSSDANTYSWSAIDEIFWALSNAQPVTYTATKFLDQYISEILELANTPYFADYLAIGNDFPTLNSPSQTRSDLSSWFQEIASLAPYGFLTIKPPDERNFNVTLQKIVAMILKRPQSFEFDEIVLTDSSIDINYSTTRDSADVYNRVSIKTKQGTVVRQDLTSVNKIGIKELEIDSDFQNPTGAFGISALTAGAELSEALLQSSATNGYPLISFTTSYDRIATRSEAPYTVKSPGAVFYKSLPLTFIDSSAVTAEEFQKRMLIQQVVHSCSPDYWELDITAANYRYAIEPQRWSEVTSNLKWSDVPSYLTWDMIRTKDL